jgi:rare lipoprotein A
VKKYLVILLISFSSFAQEIAKDTLGALVEEDSLCYDAYYSYKVLHTNAQTSYYANKFNGRKTASGEIFNNKKYTAAHRSLPFGTKLRLTNPINGKQTVVTVNDRGPFTKGRTLDISKAAFQEITHHPGNGHLRIKIEIIKPLEEEEFLELIFLEKKYH